MNELTIIEHQSQRVLTTQQIAEAYGTEPERINRNFNRNQDRYKEGKHYYCLQGEPLREFKAIGQIDLLPNVSTLYLWTEKGAWLHAKSLGTDEAWDAYEILVDEYYRLKELAPAFKLPQTFAEALRLAADLSDENDALKNQVAIMAPKADFFDAVADSKDAIDIGCAAKLLDRGIGRTKMFKFLRDKQVLMQNNIPYQEFIDRGYFRVIEQSYSKPDGTQCTSRKTLVYQKGLDFIRRLLDKESNKVVAIGG